jgi:sulfoxide reductase heme-binding subunit YedZ
VLLAANLTWYVIRAGGMVGFGLLTVAVLLGLALAGRARLARWPRFALDEVHRFAGLLAGVFISLHVLILLVDPYLPFSLADLVVPGAAGYRPLATAAGVIGAELMVALALTNRLRKHLPYRLWRRAHYLNFAVWLLALAHGIAAGSDTNSFWATAFYGSSAASVAGLLAWRIATMPPAGARHRSGPAKPSGSPAQTAAEELFTNSAAALSTVRSSAAPMVGASLNDGRSEARDPVS